jgi:hypothetical protein
MDFGHDQVLPAATVCPHYFLNQLNQRIGGWGREKEEKECRLITL